MKTDSTKKENINGRPPKFKEPSRPITVTLPERTLQKLTTINIDRAQAIVKCVEIAAGNEPTRQKPVEVVEVASGKAIILVGPNNSLKKIRWLRLVEVAPARYLLTIPTGTPIESLEVAILDIIENLSDKEEKERPLLESLRQLISRLRRNETVSKSELLFVSI
jgi:hypothetical protein